MMDVMVHYVTCYPPDKFGKMLYACVNEKMLQIDESANGLLEFKTATGRISRHHNTPYHPCGLICQDYGTWHYSDECDTESRAIGERLP